MNNHHRSERARAFIRDYVEENSEFLHAWLEKDGTLEEVGAELVFFEVQRLHFNEKPALDGLGGLFMEDIFREAPGGEIAARRFLEECIASGHGVPRQFEGLCRELLLNKPITRNSGAARAKKGRKTRNARRDLLIWLLMKVLQDKFGLTKRTNDAREDDPDFPDSALEIIRDELSIVAPEIGEISLKRLYNSTQKFTLDNDWFTQ